MKRLLVVVLGAVALSACVGPFRDRSGDYRSAREVTPPKAPEGFEIRPLRDLYAIPAARVQAEQSGKFEVPPPPAIKLSGAQEGIAPASTPLTDVKWQLTMGQDGNGYPLLTVRGAGFDQTWDQLEKVVQDLKLSVDDKNRSVAMIYLRLPGKLTDGKDRGLKAQLKLTQSVDSWQLSVQKDEDNLAPVEESRVLLDKIMAGWQKPAAPAGDEK